MKRMSAAFIFSLFAAVTVFSQTERSWEEKFRSTPQPENIRENMKRLSAHPHHLGSPYDKDNAEWILSRFKEWGFDAHIETFDVLFPTPKERAVELIAPTRFVAKLREPALPGDPTSSQQSEQLPTYNAYSADGDVTAPLVYVNYGIPSDYEKLERMGISVKGCIVIARYGASWRGIKPKVAAEHGAVGCLIYSDPSGDGYTAGDVFPNGAFRPPDGVQRGSVMDMPVYPGDPLTPGVGATPDAKRLALKDVQVFTKIPVLPLSYADAQPLLAALNGPVAPREWSGTLPITYHIGPGAAKVHLKALFNWDRKKIYDVIATIRGSQYPDQWVIRGNHFDAWVNGAEDPISGQSVLLEEARSFGELLRQGWKPKRTIVYCAWDGEEEGLIGSTEWVEEHADELNKKAVSYINSDGNDRGYLYVEGSHSLEKFISDVAKDIVDPEKNISVWKRSQLSDIANASSAEERREIRQRSDLSIGAPGSGSDYTAFVDHAGIASLNIGYGGEDGNGIYHSIYDDFYWYTHFSDTDFSYGRALAQTVGTAMMRLADSPLLPFAYSNLSDVIKKYVDELQKLVKTQQDNVRERNTEIDEGVFSATADPKKRYVPPSIEEVPPFLNFAPLQNATDSLSRCAARYDKAAAAVKENVSIALEPVNETLIESERRLLSAAGLPNRPWFKHQIYAPGLYTGYGVKTIPAVREAIEEKQWKLAGEEIAKVAQVIENEAALIDIATTELQHIER
ncbi:MAG TPA: M28 family metallopeptidase [Bacteroidota bacterium]|nr:M28 family metallopeptidase [Bacteroidota bacterium]